MSTSRCCWWWATATVRRSICWNLCRAISTSRFRSAECEWLLMAVAHDIDWYRRHLSILSVLTVRSVRRWRCLAISLACTSFRALTDAAVAHFFVSDWRYCFAFGPKRPSPMAAFETTLRPMDLDSMRTHACPANGTMVARHLSATIGYCEWETAMAVVALLLMAAL